MSNNNREFKIESMRFAYTLKNNDGTRDVKMFSPDFNAWITIGKSKTVEGAHDVAEDFIWRASQA